ncbi:hypothetical protein PF008_g6272 [Phytophthora fragariae]|uniref:RxLR effector protein n=1 Tax=Phytophthora fragariae TaxID=53985 RepID=A0A6G0S7J1_9STRA|nr:hypothetical protein PF008_g6272 [Phytophthora fragariae]
MASQLLNAHFAISRGLAAVCCHVVLVQNSARSTCASSLTRTDKTTKELEYLSHRNC